MDARQRIGEWLSEEGRSRGYSYGLNEDGLCLMLDRDGNECVIEVLTESSMVYFYGPVADVSPDIKTELFEKALTLNLYGTKTREATLSYDPVVNRIILHYAVLVDFLDQTAFSNIFNNFLLSLEKIREIFSQMNKSSYEFIPRV